MANPDHRAILSQGVEKWNLWRTQQPNVEIDLTRADLEDAQLAGVDLHGVNLKRVTLRGANLSRSNLAWANLIHANLSEARLVSANLKDAYLIDTDLHRSDLTDADLQRAQLTEANFSSAILKGTDFTKALVSRLRLCEVDLSAVKGLGEMTHARGSSIDLATLQMSKRSIPDKFLKGVGLSDQFIAYWASLTEPAIDFHSTFISHSTCDQVFAERLYTDLQAAGVRCWFAPHDIKGGRKIHEQIDEAIRVYDKLLLILSSDSMNSAWVRTEISNARAREVNQNRQVLFPISLVPFSQIQSWNLFDADTGTDSAREIRQYFIPDFSEWKHHDSYKRVFERLLRDLQARSND
jgi:TIR domain/Pentapeptide repeats (8 copies)